MQIWYSSQLRTRKIRPAIASPLKSDGEIS